MEYERLRKHVDEKLRSYQSPEQIAGRLKRDEADEQLRLCHETIYQFILQAAKEGISYENYLRWGRRRHSYGWRGKARFKS